MLVACPSQSRNRTARQALTTAMLTSGSAYRSDLHQRRCGRRSGGSGPLSKNKAWPLPRHDQGATRSKVLTALSPVQAWLDFASLDMLWQCQQ